MLEMTGEEQFEQDANRVYAVVTDLSLLAENIPDLVSYELVSGEEMKCVVRPGFSFLRMSMKTRIHLVRDEGIRAAQLTIQSQGIGAAIEVQSRITVAPAAGGSTLRWEAQIVKRTGLVSTVSADLVRAAADQVIRAGWQRIRANLASTE